MTGDGHSTYSGNVSAVGAVGPRHRGLEGGEHVVQAVSDDHIVVNGHYESHHNHGNTKTCVRMEKKAVIEMLFMSFRVSSYINLNYREGAIKQLNRGKV